jgi:predicted transcriptional regulator of viral defense system
MIQQNSRKPARGRPSKKQTQANLLRPLGIFHLRDAIAKGVPRESLSRLVRDGLIFWLDQDIYRHPDADIDPAIEDYAIACQKFGPQAVIGGPTALFHFHLLDQAPQQIWVLVPPHKISRSKRYRCIRTKIDLTIGIEDHGLYRMTNIERSLVEGFRYATKIGLETAIKSALNAINSRLTSPAKIAKQARELGLESLIMKYWEILITAG